jgi:hypothetical protein
MSSRSQSKASKSKAFSSDGSKVPPKPRAAKYFKKERFFMGLILKEVGK